MLRNFIYLIKYLINISNHNFVQAPILRHVKPCVIFRTGSITGALVPMIEIYSNNIQYY